MLFLMLSTVFMGVELVLYTSLHVLDLEYRNTIALVNTPAILSKMTIHLPSSRGSVMVISGFALEALNECGRRTSLFNLAAVKYVCRSVGDNESALVWDCWGAIMPQSA